VLVRLRDPMTWVTLVGALLGVALMLWWTSHVRASYSDARIEPYAGLTPGPLETTVAPPL
jgi:hypothetical protein